MVICKPGLKLSGFRQVMAYSIVTRLKGTPSAAPLLILSTLLMAFTATLYGLLNGISIVIPHLFYIPLILAAFFYPRHGARLAAVVSAAYLLAVAAITHADYTETVSAAGRCLVFLVIAIVVSFLSDRVAVRERELKKAKDEWERTFNAVPDLIFLVDKEFRILRVNKAMADSLGIPAEDVVGRQCCELVHRTKSPPAACPHVQVLQDGRAHSGGMHEEVLGGDFLITATPLRDEAGAVIGSVHVARDITVSKRAEEALREKTEELDRFFSVTPDLLCIADRDGRFHRLNDTWERTLGFSRGELMEKNLADLVHPDDRESTLAAMQGEGGSSGVIGFVNRYRCSDGTYRWIEWRSHPYGNLIYIAARDITDRKRGELAILQANKKLNILSSITRHDILNKLTALYAYLDMSREMCTSESQCATIDKEIETLASLQRQIEFTRYYQDIGVREPEWHGVEETFRKAFSEVSPQGIEAEASCPGLEVYADPLIEKVFYNLIENSLRHGEHVTRIRLFAQKAKIGYLIAYEDDGAGVPADIKEKLFRRGFGKHTGLGLFLSREILAITGIMIKENGEPGKGARFEITVPDEAYRIRKTGDGS